MRRASWALLLFACGVVLAVHAVAAQSPSYHLVKKVALGGEGGWDYLNADPTSHRVFLSRGTHIMVVDPDGKVVGDIPNLKGTHGAALAPELNRGFSSNGQSNSITIFDLKTLAVVKEVPLPEAQGPDGYLYDPATKRVFVFNGRSHDATGIDAMTGEIAGTVPLGGKPEAGAADGQGHVFVNNEDKSVLVEFDSKTLKVLNNWPIEGCEHPSGLAIDTAHKRLFDGCHNQQMVVIDYTNGKTVASIPIGTGIDSTWFDPATRLAFSSCGNGTIIAAHEDTPDKYTVVDTIQTENGARTMALDTGNHNIYTVTADFAPAAAPTPETPNPRPRPLPGTFRLLIFAK